MTTTDSLTAATRTALDIIEAAELLHAVAVDTSDVLVAMRSLMEADALLATLPAVHSAPRAAETMQQLVNDTWAALRSPRTSFSATRKPRHLVVVK